MKWIRPRAWVYLWPIVLIAGVLLATTLTQKERPLLASDNGQGNLPEAGDINPDPNIFETFLVAMESPVDLGNGVTATTMTFNGIVPGPLIRVKVGDKIIVHFTNNLPIPASIHWHGIELTNRSDGTGITQDPVPTGGTFTYDFIVPRQGIFFYHSHIAPTNPEFKGYYGPLIVEDPNEQKLIAKQVIPNRGNTKTLIIGDTTVCKGEGLNDAVTFPADANLPWAFNPDGTGGPPFPGWPADTPISTPTELCDTPLDEHGHFVTPAVALPAGAIPNIQPTPDCGGTEPGCQTGEGQLLLVNGRVPAARGGFPGNPGALAANARTINVKAGDGIRLQLGSAATIRYLRLRLTCPSATPCVEGLLDNQIPLFRIGGQGGLLDSVRLEGGTQGTLNTQYAPGEILLPVASREDIVFVVPSVAQGQVLTLWTLDYPRTGGGATVPLPTVPVAHFKVVGATSKNARFAIAAGDPLRTHPAVNYPTESLKSAPVDALLDSSLFAPPELGSPDPTIKLTAGAKPSINGTTNFIFDEGPTPPDLFTDVPHVTESRWATVGTLLELTIFNDTAAHHPWHPHGFSIQPVKFTDAGGATLFTHPYNEFVDVVDIPPHTKLVYRVRLDDRPLDFNTPTGGAVGRWAMHCHIFFHAALGMITELVAIP
jgi:FtsP/CotA-like multicopper oxidase with cupredoxin domain